MSYHAVDFGTSNSLLNLVHQQKITPVMLEDHAPVLRSLLYSPAQHQWHFGQEAIAEYVSNSGEGRFLRSIKKFLPEPSYTGTSIWNRNYNISELIAIILGEMRKRAIAQTGVPVDRVVMGRPALYSLEPEQDQLAQERMHKACLLAGYKEVIFCPEPVAAGLDYQSLDQSEKIVLIADFGGGTSDFTLMKISRKPYSKDDILGLSGVFIAGDVLDGMMMRDFIAPHFASEFEYKLPGSSNLLKFPRNLLKKICSPAHITHLREKDTWEFLQHIGKFALDEQDEARIKNLYTLVECQLGFPLFHEIEKAKITLGSAAETIFRYEDLVLSIEQLVTNQGYRQSVTPSVGEIIATMQEVFKQSGLKAADVDLVCLTGGTSQFPMIREQLSAIFGQSKMREHNIYQSVVNGLSHFALTTSQG